MEKKQPEWSVPVNTAKPELKVYNSLTRTKVPFIPQKGKLITWYSCGPTVYDASHMGHARNYISFDIIRRILEDYFGYDVFYVMNITDIDDKIIVRARQNYLIEQFKNENQNLSETLKSLVFSLWIKFAEKSFSLKVTETDVDKISAFVEANAKNNNDEKFSLNMETFKKVSLALKHATTASGLIEASSDILGKYLDVEKGSSVTDQKIFRDLSAYWEKDFLLDMDALNVKRANVLTRVSEYVPEIVRCVEQIIKNGYAYESDGSVYFDTNTFHGKNGHFYAKLCPWSAGNAKLTDEGEGALSLFGAKKKSAHDFALWKKSKPGEPEWDSPWSKGRPGWHIECSAMASDVVPGTIDIHSGGIDLTFPHHDNELAQSEGCFELGQWINYFLHAGHLHIEGQKMSKSLKNFITIKEALEKYTARQIRLMFLQHGWNSVLDYKESSMAAAISLETTFFNFFANAEALIREGKVTAHESNGKHNYREDEKLLMENLMNAQHKVNESLCDSFDTPSSMQALVELVNLTNIYMMKKQRECINVSVLERVSCYITRILKVFGVIESPMEIGFGTQSSQTMNNDTVLPILQAVSQYRDSIRELAIQKKDYSEFLKLSDKLRDEDLLEVGVILEDREGSKALVKLADKMAIMKIRDEKKQKELEKIKRKEQAQEQLQERLEKGKLDPKKMFYDESLYSEYDEQGIPTRDVQGVELAKSKRKKMQKEYEAQQKLHDEYLKSQQ